MYIGEGLLEPVRKYFIKLKLTLITLVHQVVWVLPFPSASAGGRAAAQAMCVCQAATGCECRALLERTHLELCTVSGISVAGFEQWHGARAE